MSYKDVTYPVGCEKHTIREGHSMENVQFVITRKDDEDHLEHHGVKGQKWGVRRYQNEDGSLTAEGQKQREKIEKWYNSSSGRGERNAFKKKGMTSYDAYKSHRMVKSGVIGQVIAGPLAAGVSAFVSHKRVSAGREFFESEIARLEKQQG